jgi:SOS-response transcriptional repressor LexA
VGFARLISEARFQLVRIPDFNMSPTNSHLIPQQGIIGQPIDDLQDGDVILVDMTQRSPNPPGVFVLHDGMGLVAKRLEFIPMSDPPRVRIISDNQQYSTYDCTADEVNIIGRVRWYGREM